MTIRLKLKQSYINTHSQSGPRLYAAPPTIPVTTTVAPTTTVTTDPQPLTPTGLLDAKGSPLVLDRSQYSVLEHFYSDKHLVILGKAGTGKTTIVQALCLLYSQDNPSSMTNYRIKGSNGQYESAPKMAIAAFTNRATNNIEAKIVINPILANTFGANITTCHNLLEYTVEFVLDLNTGLTKRHYYPQRDDSNQLDIDILILEESTMIGVGEKSLWQELYSALPSHCKVIMLGDINQLPPVIGKPVLSYAIQSDDFQVCELTTVHRQALDNPIIRQAHRCLEGKSIESDIITGPDNKPRGVQVFHGKAKFKLSWAEYEKGLLDVLDHFQSQGLYNPYEDMVLNPFNKPKDHGVSAQNIAKAIASRLAERENRKVYEIQTGFQKVYYAIGDRVFYDKRDGVITNITHNIRYFGKAPRDASYHIDHFGTIRINSKIANGGNGGEDIATDLDFLHEDNDIDYNASIDNLLDNPDNLKEERVRTASHTVEITFPDGQVLSCSTVGEYGELQLGYALSVHKAQGSEWPNVFVALHDTNTTLLFRELLYTAMTRPQKFLGIVAQKHVLEKALSRQRIKGNTLADKIEFFNGGYLDQEVALNPALK